MRAESACLFRVRVGNWGHQHEIAEAEIPHRASRRADVAGDFRPHQNDAARWIVMASSFG